MSTGTGTGSEETETSEDSGELAMLQREDLAQFSLSQYSATSFGPDEIQRAIDGNIFLQQIQTDLIHKIELEEDQEMCRRAAAALVQSGRLDSMAVPILKSSNLPEESRRRRVQRKELKRHRSQAIQELQAVGFLPTGLGWLVVRWVVVPFLTRLISMYVFGNYDGD